MMGGYVFTGVSVQLSGRGWVPPSGRQGCYSIQLMGVPNLANGGGYSIVPNMGSTPSFLTWGTHILPDTGMSGYPPPNKKGWGYPPLGLDGGTPHPDIGWRSPPSCPGKGIPDPLSWPRTWMGGDSQQEQQSEYLLRGGWYASCVYAGGLSCFVLFFHFSMFSQLQLLLCIYE